MATFLCFLMLMSLCNAHSQVTHLKSNKGEVSKINVKENESSELVPEPIMDENDFPELNGEDALHSIQDDHFEIIKLDNLLAKKLSHLSERIENAIKSEDITLEDAKRVLGWREVQTLFKHQYEKDQDRLEWEWEGSWGAKTRRVLNGGPSHWFGQMKKML